MGRIPSFKHLLSVALAAILCLSAVSASEKDILVSRVARLKKEYKMAQKKASFYEHQVFDRQFSKRGGSETKRLRRKIAQWKLKSHDLYQAIERLESQIASEE